MRGKAKLSEEKILKIRELFVQDVTLNEICEVAGCTRPTLYRYAGDLKEKRNKARNSPNSKKNIDKTPPELVEMQERARRMSVIKKFKTLQIGKKMGKEINLFSTLEIEDMIELYKKSLLSDTKTRMSRLSLITSFATKAHNEIVDRSKDGQSISSAELDRLCNIELKIAKIAGDDFKERTYLSKEKVFRKEDDDTRSPIKQDKEIVTEDTIASAAKQIKDLFKKKKKE